MIFSNMPCQFSIGKRLNIIKTPDLNSNSTIKTNNRSSRGKGNISRINRLSRRYDKKAYILSNIMNMMSMALVINLLGAVDDADQMAKLCQAINPARLTENNLNGILLENILCLNTNLDDYVPADPAAVKALMSDWIAGLWLQQTYVMFTGHYSELCKGFNPSQADGINMNGTLLKEVMCNQAKKGG